jgi:hypothetical protein
VDTINVFSLRSAVSLCGEKGVCWSLEPEAFC